MNIDRTALMFRAIRDVPRLATGRGDPRGRGGRRWCWQVIVRVSVVLVDKRAWVRLDNDFVQRSARYLLAQYPFTGSIF